MPKAKAAQQEYLYGIHSVREALRADRRKIVKIYLASMNSWRAFMEPLEGQLKTRSIGIEVKDRRDLQKLCRSQEHQGIVALASPYPYCGADAALAHHGGGKPPLYVLLDQVQDPHNLGGILRTAECSGVNAVFLTARHAAGITPAVVRASAGAAEHLDICKVGNLVGFMDRIRDRGVWIYGLEADGDRLWTDLDLTGATAVVAGGEGSGLRRLVRERCDAVARLPVAGKLGCLNVSVAAGVALYEVLRQRGAGRGDVGRR